jgi:hypothetical protein
MAEDGIFMRDVVAGLDGAVVVEDIRRASRIARVFTLTPVAV